MVVYFLTASNNIPGGLALLACTSQNKVAYSVVAHFVLLPLVLMI